MQTWRRPVARARQMKQWTWFGAFLIGTTMLAGNAQAFFPSLPVANAAAGNTGNNGNNGNNQGNHGTTQTPTDRNVTPPGGNGPPAPPITPPETPPNIPIGPQPPSGPGAGVPEVDPSGMAGAFGILVSGALMLTDRRRRK